MTAQPETFSDCPNCGSFLFAVMYGTMLELKCYRCGGCWSISEEEASDA